MRYFFSCLFTLITNLSVNNVAATQCNYACGCGEGALLKFDSSIRKGKYLCDLGNNRLQAPQRIVSKRENIH